MKIVEKITRDDDYRQTLTIEVNGKGIFCVVMDLRVVQ